MPWIYSTNLIPKGSTAYWLIIYNGGGPGMMTSWVNVLTPKPADLNVDARAHVWEENELP